MTFHYNLNFLTDEKLDTSTFSSIQPVQRLDLIDLDGDTFVVMAIHHSESATTLHIANGQQTVIEAVMISADPRRLALEVEQFDPFSEPQGQGLE